MGETHGQIRYPRFALAPSGISFEKGERLPAWPWPGRASTQNVSALAKHNHRGNFICFFAGPLGGGRLANTPPANASS